LRPSSSDSQNQSARAGAFASSQETSRRKARHFVEKPAALLYNMGMNGQKRSFTFGDLAALALIASMVCAAVAMVVAFFALTKPSAKAPQKTAAPVAEELSAKRAETAVSPAVKTPSSPAPEDPLPQPDFYSFVWLTDTQYYMSDYPHICFEMTRWIANSVQPLNIQYVFMTGDFVDDRTPEQWERAQTAMQALDGSVPWFCIAGNHDVGTSSPDYGDFVKRFGEEHFKSLGTNSTFYRKGVGRYDLFSHGGRDYLFLGMGFKAADGEGLRWMKSVLKAYPDRCAILLFHEYLATDGTLLSSGRKILDEIVKKFTNVKLVLCGHRYASRAIPAEFDDDGDGETDRTVWQIMGNYQAIGNGGQGYLRILKVYDDRIEMVAYSPYLEDYNWTDDWEEPQTESLVIDTTGW